MLLTTQSESIRSSAWRRSALAYGKELRNPIGGMCGLIWEGLLFP